MALLKPNQIYTMNGVTVNEKIIPDGTRWRDATKAANAGFSAGSLYKKQQKLSGGTGKAKKVTVHNTNDLDNVHDDGEQYTRATYNENMLSSRVQFYIDDIGAWQNLRAGTGLCSADPVGSAEVGWHSGDGSVSDGGNMTSLSLEIIMNESKAHDEKAKDNGARIAAWLLWKHGLTINDLVTHTYWVNKSAGKSFSDVDEQCCNPIYGRKWCPTYIFASSNKQTAMRNWKAFKQLVKGYLDALGGAEDKPTVTEKPSTPTTDTAKTIWDFLTKKGLNAYAVAGIMGNLYAESALKPTNLQNTYEKKLGFSDTTYTQAVDNGSYTNFVNDSAGYGLAQWTYWSRKQALLHYAQKTKKSIGDLQMQLEFMWQELQGYKGVMKTLKTATSIQVASDAILTEYERPANQSDAVKAKRAGYGKKYYDQYAPKTPIAFTPYLVKITASVLNIRKQPTTSSAVTGAIRDRGVYTIVEEASGAGATRWGKLKSGAGWISLDYTKKI